MNIKLWFVFSIIPILLSGCSKVSDGALEKVQNKRDLVESVAPIIPIETDVILSGLIDFFIVDNIFIVVDIKSLDKGIHLFDKEDYKHLCSVGTIGKGPGEISYYGKPMPVYDSRKFWMFDHGKLVVYEFDLDNNICEVHYLPKPRYEFSRTGFLSGVDKILDEEIVIGRGIIPTSAGTYKETIARYNFVTGEFDPFGYTHPDSQNDFARSQFAISKENKIYVRTFSTMDLMTICDLDGNLKYNIYGPLWGDSSRERIKKRYFRGVKIAGNYILASYLGGQYIEFDQHKRQIGVGANQLIVFDTEGTYIKTLDLGEEIDSFVVDEQNNRIIVSFTERTPSLGYFDLTFDLHE